MSDAYTYDVSTGGQNDTSPPAPRGGAVGDVPSFGAAAVEPSAPKGNADHVGVFTGLPDSSGETEPKPPVVC